MARCKDQKVNYGSMTPALRPAFSLAEVLTALGIIGVVAAMTIPTLMQNVQQNQWKQAWKKEYSTISQIYEQIKQDEGGDLSAYFAVNNGTKPIVVKMGDYLSSVESCGTGGNYNYVCGDPLNSLLSNFYLTLSGQYIDSNNLNFGQYILKDGAQIYFRTWDAGWLLAWVDVNGASKKPNTLGKDLFGITITKDKVMPMGAVGTGSENTCNSTPTTAGYGVGNNSDTAGAGCSSEYLYQ